MRDIRGGGRHQSRPHPGMSTQAWMCYGTVLEGRYLREMSGIIIGNEGILYTCPHSDQISVGDETLLDCTGVVEHRTSVLHLVAMKHAHECHARIVVDVEYVTEGVLHVLRIDNEWWDGCRVVSKANRTE